MADTVRVRFAPSPTGYLHVGGLRTALYNYLFARRHGGVFVLRIEDTDRTRLVPGAAEQLVEMLHWSGLTFDEGPGVGGPCGPYVQSERLALYRAAVEQLLAAGHAYRCFCPPARLEAMREAQQQAKQTVKYDRHCHTLAPADVTARVAAGEPHVVRMLVPDGAPVVFEDRVRGRVEFATETIDDQVLLKSDGYPTYHLANVVDDHAMGITHVIRGEEWLSSTPKHVLLYRALGHAHPEFAHLPLLLNPDRTKLSKRQGDVAVEDYRGHGYFPAALVNFVALLGWNPGDDRELFTLPDLCAAFSLERVNKAGAIFNLDKLRWFNQEYLKRTDPAAIGAVLGATLAARGAVVPGAAQLAAAAALMRERVTFPEEILDRAPYLFAEPTAFDPEAVARRWTSRTPALLESLWTRLDILATFDAVSIEAALQAEAAAAGVKPAELIHPLRIAVSGTGAGPGIYELLEALGRERCAARLRRALETLPPPA